MSEYRINGFEQIKAFYSWVFNNAKERVTPQHISLYLFLINQNNRSNWIEWFKVPFDLGMAGACIGNKKTYYSCLNDLVSWNLIEYEKGTNEYKAPLIKIAVLKSTSHDTAPVPLPEPLLQPLPTTLPIPLPTHIYKLITDNLKLITDNEKKFEIFIQSLKNPKEKIYDLSFVNIEYLTLVEKWLRYKKDKKQQYKNSESVKAFYKSLLTLSNNNPLTAEKIIERSMANNWAGLFELKTETQTQKTTPLIADTSEVDKARRLQQEYLNSLKQHETLIN